MRLPNANGSEKVVGFLEAVTERYPSGIGITMPHAAKANQWQRSQDPPSPSKMTEEAPNMDVGR